MQFQSTSPQPNPCPPVFAALFIPSSLPSQAPLPSTGNPRRLRLPRSLPPTSGDPAEFEDINTWPREDVEEFYACYKQSHLLEWEGQVMTYAEFEALKEEQEAKEKLGLGKDTLSELYYSVPRELRPPGLRFAWAGRMLYLPWEKGLHGLVSVTLQV